MSPTLHETPEEPGNRSMTGRPAKKPRTSRGTTKSLDSKEECTPLQPQISEYERQRLENIRQNEAMIASLEIGAAKSHLVASVLVPETVSNNANKSVPNGVTRERKRKPVRDVKLPAVKRVSTRLRGLPATPVSVQGDEEPVDNILPDDIDIERGTKMYDSEEFFDKEIAEKAIRVDGHYKGWVNPDIMEAHGFEANATEAWEKNGGGKFSFKDPCGDGQKVGKGHVAGGVSTARLTAQKLFKKNPNAYFYRLTEPDVKQSQGDWTAEEKDIFLKVAREHGCGDKWGLFSTYLPHRVGYQCSAFYRQVIIAEGLVFDKNYKLTSSGTAVYVGRRGRSSS